MITAAYATESVLETLPLPADVISDLTELDRATNERKFTERGGNAAISLGELLYGVAERTSSTPLSFAFAPFN